MCSKKKAGMKSASILAVERLIASCVENMIKTACIYTATAPEVRKFH